MRKYWNNHRSLLSARQSSTLLMREGRRKPALYSTHHRTSPHHQPDCIPRAAVLHAPLHAGCNASSQGWAWGFVRHARQIGPAHALSPLPKQLGGRLRRRHSAPAATRGSMRCALPLPALAGETYTAHAAVIAAVHTAASSRWTHVQTEVSGENTN